MIGRIVITNVPRGLDGGTGFQPVLRTRGLRPSIAQRLVMRSAYPHPYPIGDPRNPHVVFHRIELVDGQTIHVLGSVRDAGASYTGRSNYLADLIAIDQAETGSLLGGPAYAAQSFPWIRAWTGEPRETPLAQEPTVAARDADDPAATGRPAACPAWQRATGDAGWAGELAKSFVDGRRALIWAGDGSDVLELFAEALRLLPAQVRWQVTFNTCEIEPFPSHWRAVRPDLGLVGNYDPKNELRLVLGKLREAGSRAPDHEFSRRARGELIGAASPSSEAQARVVESGNPSGPTPPSVHAPADTATNDAVLREQLRHIRESRQRRSGIAPTTDAAPARYRSSVALFLNLLLGFLLVAAVAAVAVGTAAMRSPELFQGSPSVLLASSTPRARPKEAVQPTTSDTAPDKSHPSVEFNTGRSASPASPQPAALPQPTAAQPYKSADKAKHDRAREAYKAFVLLSGTLVPTGPDLTNLESDLSANPAAGTAMPVGFAAADFDPRITPTIFSPFTKQSRLRLKLREHNGDWVITGLPPLGPGDSASEGGESSNDRLHTNICTVAITDGTLSVTHHVAASHDLYARLQNSLLVLSTRDPADSKTESVTRLLQFARPLKPLCIKIDARNPRMSTRFPELERRTKGIPPEMMSYELVWSHPSLDGGQKVVRKNFGSPPTPITVDFPPNGIRIQYHDAPTAPSGTAAVQNQPWVIRKGALQVTGTLTFPSTTEHPLRIESTFSFADTLSDCDRIKSRVTQWQKLEKLLTLERKGLIKEFRKVFPVTLKGADSEGDRPLITAAFASFASGRDPPYTVSFGCLCEPDNQKTPQTEPDAKSTDMIRSLDDFQRARLRLNELTSNAITEPGNYGREVGAGGRSVIGDTAAKIIKENKGAIKHADQQMTDILNDFEKFLGSTCAPEIDTLAKEFAAAAKQNLFDPIIAIEIRELRVKVFDDHGAERDVLVVEP